MENDLAGIKKYIQSEGDINKIGMFRDTLLIMAAKKGCVEIVRLLVEAKACPFFKNYHGQTAYEEVMWWKERNQKKIDGFTQVSALLQQ